MKSRIKIGDTVRINLAWFKPTDLFKVDKIFSDIGFDQPHPIALLMKNKTYATTCHVAHLILAEPKASRKTVRPSTGRTTKPVRKPLK